MHYVLTEFGDRVGAEFAQWFLGLVWKSQVSADGTEEGDAAAVVVEYWLKDLADSLFGAFLNIVPCPALAFARCWDRISTVDRSVAWVSRRPSRFGTRLSGGGVWVELWWGRCGVGGECGEVVAQGGQGSGGEVGALGEQGVQGAGPADDRHGAVLGAGGVQDRGEVLTGRYD